MKSALLIRNSSFQRFCANKLFKMGIIDTVYVESGNSFDAGGSVFKKLKKATPHIKNILKNPEQLPYYIFKFRDNGKYFGSQEEYNSSILVDDYQDFNSGLKINFVNSINDAQTISDIESLNLDILFVFGTGIIKKNFFEKVKCPKINLHWGISPNYRGEGIISSLAKEGIGGPGLTVHLLAEKVDAGNVLYQARPKVTRDDNFYSIGLKLTLLGVDIFKQVAEDFSQGRSFEGKPQDLSVGAVYTSRVMRFNPKMFHQAWRNLKTEYGTLDVT